MDYQTAKNLEGIWKWKPKGEASATVEIKVVAEYITFLVKEDNGDWENIGFSRLDGNPDTKNLLVHWRDTLSSPKGNPLAQNWQTSLIENISQNEFKNRCPSNFPEYGNWTR